MCIDVSRSLHRRVRSPYSFHCQLLPCSSRLMPYCYSLRNRGIRAKPSRRSGRAMARSTKLFTRKKEGNVCVVFLPNAHSLGFLNQIIAGTLYRDYIRIACLDRCCAGRGGAVCVVIGYGVAPGERLIAVICSESFPAVLKVLKTAASIREASDAVLLQFEKPGDQSERNA